VIWRAGPDDGPVVLARDYVPLLMSDPGRARSSRDGGFGPLAPDPVRHIQVGLLCALSSPEAEQTTGPSSQRSTPPRMSARS